MTQHVHVAIFCGQSNTLGPETGSVPVGIPLAAVRYMLRVPNDAATNDLVFRDLDVRVSDNTHGMELQFGLDMDGFGYDLAIVKVARGNTFISEWIPGTVNGNALLAKVGEAQALLAAAFPGKTPVYHFIWYQGESEAKDATDTAALGWGDNFDLIQAGLEALTGPLKPLIVKTHSDTGSAPYLSIVQAQQLSRAWILQSVDSVPLAGDQTHFSAANYNVIGSLVASTLHASISTMTIAHGATTRTAIANLVVDRVDQGAAEGELLIRDGATVLATITLDDPAFDAAVGPSAALLGVPLNATATDDGEADNFVITDSDGNTIFSGSVTATGGGGDLTLDTTTIVTSDTVTVTSGSYTAPP